MFKHREPRYQYSTCPSLNVDSEGVLFWNICIVTKEKISDENNLTLVILSHTSEKLRPVTTIVN